MISTFFKDENSKLFLADSLELLEKFSAEFVDVIFADPPYFLSNNGITCKNGKVASESAWLLNKKALIRDKIYELNTDENIDILIDRGLLII